MSRVDIIASAIGAYCAGNDTLPGTPERTRELALLIDNHLAPGDTEAVITLRLLRAVLNEAFQGSVRRSP